MKDLNPVSSAPSRARIRSGWMLHLLGWAGAVRLLPESLTLRPQDLATFKWVILYDLVLASAMVIAGRWLSLGKKWATVLCIVASGAWLEASLLWTGGLIYALHRFAHQTFSPRILSDVTFWALFPRFLYHGLGLAVAPYVIRTLLRESSLRPSGTLDTGPSFGALWLFLIASFLFPIAFAFTAAIVVSVIK